MTAVITVQNVGFTIQNHTILKDVSLYVNEGEFVGIIGPNGSGKSTLLKNIYKVYTPTAGCIRLYGKDVTGISNRQAANMLAVVAQEDNANFDFTVEEVVAMGRYPQKRMLDTLNDADYQIVAQAVQQVGMQRFIKHSFLELSGGEKQRVLFARALAQQTDVIILDEPTNHLDIGSQISTLRLMKSSGKAVLAALHDLTIAANYCDRVYVLHKGGILCAGTPTEVITEPLIHTLYGIRANVFEHNQKTFVDFH